MKYCKNYYMNDDKWLSFELDGVFSDDTNPPDVEDTLIRVRVDAITTYTSYDLVTRSPNWGSVGDGFLYSHNGYCLKLGVAHKEPINIYFRHWSDFADALRWLEDKLR